MQFAVKVNFEQYIRLALSHAQFSQNEDGSWTVDIPVLPGCVTWGATRSEAVEMPEKPSEVIDKLHRAGLEGSLSSKAI